MQVCIAACTSVISLSGTIALPLGGNMLPHARSKALLLHGHAGCSNRHKHVVTMAAAAVATCTWHAGI